MLISVSSHSKSGATLLFRLLFVVNPLVLYNSFFKYEMNSADIDSDHLGTPVYLNIYDLHPYNKYVYWMGLGAFHAGVEINGVEWSFGYVSGPGTGVFQCEPRQAPGATYRETMPLGYTSKSGWQIDNVIAEMRISYRGCDYHMYLHNCIDFSADLAKALTGAEIPRWLSRLPHMANAIRCCLPKSLRGPYPAGMEEETGDYEGFESNTYGEKSALIAPPRADKKSQAGVPSLVPPKAGSTLGINSTDSDTSVTAISSEPSGSETGSGVAIL